MRFPIILYSALLSTVLVAPAVALAPKVAAAQGRGPRSDARGSMVDEINLAVGETKTLSARGVRNFSEGVPGIIEIKLTSDNANFILTGRKPGATTVLFINSDGSQQTLNINVWVRPPAVVERELNEFLDGVAGIRIRRVGSRILIDGSVISESELKRVQQVAALYQGQVEAIVTVASPSSAPPDEQRYIVRVDFYFVQFDKNSSYGVGINWPAAYGGDTALRAAVNWDLTTGNVTSATASLANQPLPRLDLASRHGWAKVLKQASVVTNNGVEASFQNGGEQNFSITQGLTAGIQSVSYGADVTVLPRYRPERREVDVKVVANVSDLTAAASGSSIPGRITSKLTTNVSLKLGQALILSGIKSRSQTHAVAGLPILSEVPVLGLLFGSHSNNEVETEGAIFVVPSVLANVGTPASELVDAAVSSFKKYTGDLSVVRTSPESNRDPGSSAAPNPTTPSPSPPPPGPSAPEPKPRK